jgi:transposase
LISKAEEKGIHVIIQDVVGVENIQNIGGLETYKCKNCRIKIDRDVNGAYMQYQISTSV